MYRSEVIAHLRAKGVRVSVPQIKRAIQLGRVAAPQKAGPDGHFDYSLADEIALEKYFRGKQDRRGGTAA